jgi:hypothetical protein
MTKNAATVATDKKSSTIVRKIKVNNPVWTVEAAMEFAVSKGYKLASLEKNARAWDRQTGRPALKKLLLRDEISFSASITKMRKAAAKTSTTITTLNDALELAEEKGFELASLEANKTFWQQQTCSNSRKKLKLSNGNDSPAIRHMKDGSGQYLIHRPNTRKEFVPGSNSSMSNITEAKSFKFFDTLKEHGINYIHCYDTMIVDIILQYKGKYIPVQVKSSFTDLVQHHLTNDDITGKYKDMIIIIIGMTGDTMDPDINSGTISCVWGFSQRHFINNDPIVAGTSHLSRYKSYGTPLYCGNVQGQGPFSLATFVDKFRIELDAQLEHQGDDPKFTLESMLYQYGPSSLNRHVTPENIKEVDSIYSVYKYIRDHLPAEHGIRAPRMQKSAIDAIYNNGVKDIHLSFKTTSYGNSGYDDTSSTYFRIETAYMIELVDYFIVRDDTDWHLVPGEDVRKCTTNSFSFNGKYHFAKSRVYPKESLADVMNKMV